MKHFYKDIRSRISELPSWWDEHGVPRYGAFTPKSVSNIYADECALLLIACQNCRHTFRVAMSWDRETPPPVDVLRAHYGDPPNGECCDAGPTMNCDDLRVLEWWVNTRASANGWIRKYKNEILLPDHLEYVEK